MSVPLPPFKIGFEEGLLTLRELVELPELRRARIEYWRLRSWVYVGLNGKQLPTMKIGGVRYTTAERVLTFALQEEEPKSFELPQERIVTHALAEHRRLEAMLFKPDKRNANKGGSNHDHEDRTEVSPDAREETGTESAEKGETEGTDPAPDPRP